MTLDYGPIGAPEGEANAIELQYQPVVTDVMAYGFCDEETSGHVEVFWVAHEVLRRLPENERKLAQVFMHEFTVGKCRSPRSCAFTLMHQVADSHNTMV